MPPPRGGGGGPPIAGGTYVIATVCVNDACHKGIVHIF